VKWYLDVIYNGETFSHLPYLNHDPSHALFASKPKWGKDCISTHHTPIYTLKGIECSPNMH